MRRADQRGMTLVELMVGLVVGMLVSLAILRVAAGFEGYKRSVVSGSDAQVSGAVAALQLQRDLQMAGYGVAGYPAALGCTIRGRHDGTDIAPFALAPVLITKGVGAEPDALALLASASPTAVMPMRVTKDHAGSASSFAVGSSIGVRTGDLLIAVPQAWDATTGCSVFAATNEATNAALTLTSGNVPHGGSNLWNTGLASVFPAAGYLEGGVLLNVGSLTRRLYAIGGDALQVTTAGADGALLASADAFAQIVMLRALYGKDTDADGRVDRYDRTTPATAAAWSQVLAVRFALVARSVEREKNEVSGAALDWDLGAAVPVDGAAACGARSQCLDLRPPSAASDGGEWRHYRYKVFDTIAPLRNILWHS